MVEISGSKRHQQFRISAEDSYRLCFVPAQKEVMWAEPSTNTEVELLKPFRIHIPPWCTPDAEYGATRLTICSAGVCLVFVLFFSTLILHSLFDWEFLVCAIALWYYFTCIFIFSGITQIVVSLNLWRSFHLGVFQNFILLRLWRRDTAF